MLYRGNSVWLVLSLGATQLVIRTYKKDQLKILKSEPCRALGSLLMADGQSSHPLLRGRPEGAS